MRSLLFAWFPGWIQREVNALIANHGECFNSFQSYDTADFQCSSRYRIGRSGQRRHIEDFNSTPGRPPSRQCHTRRREPAESCRRVWRGASRDAASRTACPTQNGTGGCSSAFESPGGRSRIHSPGYGHENQAGCRIRGEGPERARLPGAARSARIRALGRQTLPCAGRPVCLEGSGRKSEGEARASRVQTLHPALSEGLEWLHDSMNQ